LTLPLNGSIDVQPNFDCASRSVLAAIDPYATARATREILPVPRGAASKKQQQLLPF
jgi:hypothetical protein